MGTIIFVREDLLKATHKELKWIESFTDKHGHVHRGHHKHVLVADDHNNVKVATGQGSFYQKIAHKNAMADIPNFQSLDIDHQANIILHHATGLQAAASASAAVSGFKSSMLAGKVPTPAQYFAMQNATTNVQADVAAACAAAIGAEKYEQFLSAASAKANQPKGKASEPQTPQAVQASQKGQTPGTPAAAVTPAEPAKSAAPSQDGVAAQAAVEAELPPDVKAKDGPKAPTPPKFKDLNHGMVASQWGKMFESGDHQTLKDSLSTLAGNMKANPSLGNDPDTLALMKYALEVGSALLGAAALPGDKTSTGPGNSANAVAAAVLTDDSTNHKAAVAAFEGGSYYQKEALKKLKAEHGPAWDAMHPSKQLDLAHAKYQALQGAASQAAAVSSWKKHMLAGQVPTPSEVKAMAAFDASTPDKALKVMNEVKAAIGMDAYIQLVTQAHAKAAKAPAAAPVAAKPVKAAGAKVFVTKDANAASGDTGKKNTLAAPKLVSVQDVINSNVADIGGWKKTGDQEGSNPGGYFTDPNGQQWYCKFPTDPDAAKSELLAIKLYAACGIDVPDMKAVMRNGKPGVASKVITGLKKSKDGLASAAGSADGFAVDAWLANWDTVGQGFDNLQIKGGKAIRVDVGGSLDYRAQGGKKGAAFGSVVTELASMRDPSKNSQTAHVFGSLTDAQIGESAKHIFRLKDTAIMKLCNAYGPGSTAEKHALAQKLIDRKKDLAEKFPSAYAEFAPKISVVLPMKPNFKEWNGPGKGLSSKAIFNDQNQAIADQINDLAAKGKADELANMLYQPINDAGAPTGPMVPLSGHKSQHLPKYLEDVVKAIQNPVAVMPSGLVDAAIDAGGGGLFGSLLSFFDDVKSLASSAYNLGRYAITGKVEGDGLFDAWQYTPKSMKNGKLSAAQHYADSMASFKKLPQTQQNAIKAYTGSAYHTMNNPLTGVGTHGSTDFAIDGIDKAAIPLEEGTVLSRKFSFANDSTENLDKLMQSEGCLLKDFGIISTAMTPGTWHGAIQLHITCAEGVRGLYVAKNPNGGGSAISANSGENEIILPYGTKFFVKKVHEKGHTFEDEHGSWSAGVIIEVIALPN